MNTRTSLLMVGVLFLTASAAWAGEGGTVEQGTVRVSGEGSIWALGKGAIEYDLNGTGTLMVFDSSVNRISFIGSGGHSSDGRVTTFTGFKGSVRVEGPNVASRFADGKVEVRGTGALSLLLTGEGQYWLNDGPAHNWNKDGTLVGVGPPAPPAAEKPAAARFVAPPTPPAAPAVTTVEIAPIEIRTVPVYVLEPRTVFRTTWVSYYDYPTVSYSWSTRPWYYSSASRPPHYVRPYCPSPPPPKPLPVCPPPRTTIRTGASTYITGPPLWGRLPAVPTVSGTPSCGGTVRTGGRSSSGLAGPPPGGTSVRHVPPTPPGGGSVRNVPPPPPGGGTQFGGRGPR